MKIAVTASGDNLDSQVDPRFGRCRYFIIVDADTMRFEVVENQNLQASSGAGIATAQMIAEKKVEAVITGNVGPNAYQTLSAAGIKIVIGASGTIRQAMQSYKEGKFQSSSGPSVEAHFGMGESMPLGAGATGPGMGMGMGRGMGMGMGRGFYQAPYGPGQTGSQPEMSREQELSMLKNQTQNIGKQLHEIKKRIEELNAQ